MNCEKSKEAEKAADLEKVAGWVSTVHLVPLSTSNSSCPCPGHL